MSDMSNANTLADVLIDKSTELESLSKQYASIFGKEPYLGGPIGELSLPEQLDAIKSHQKLVQQAITSRVPIPNEPTQRMGDGIPPPIFCTGQNHCAIAAMLSMISLLCGLLGYHGDSPKRSFSINFGLRFKTQVLKVPGSQCITIENIYRHLDDFLQLLATEYPPYAPYLGRMFTTFFSRTFSRQSDGTCTPIPRGREVPSTTTMLEESAAEFSERIQGCILSCGSERVHTHLRMDPRVVTTFGLPCAMPNDLGGLIEQVELTATMFKSFELDGNCPNGASFNATTRFFAAFCDTRSRNPLIDARRVLHQSTGTSHYYLIIRKDGVWYLVDSNSTNVRILSEDEVLQHVNQNAILILMQNSSFSFVQPVQSTTTASFSGCVSLHPSPAAAGGGAATPAPLSRPHLHPSPAAVGGGAATPAPLSRPHLHPSPAVAGGGGHIDSRGKPLRPLPSCPNSPSSYILSLPAGCLDKKDPSSFFKNVEEIAQSARGNPADSFFVSPLCLTLHDLQNVFHIFGSFPIGSERYRVIACMFDNGECVKYTKSPKDLSIESEKIFFSSQVASVLIDSKRTLVCVFVSKCT
jgi:hypothetical protein